MYVAWLGHHVLVTKWEYARLEYNATGSFGTDKNLDWAATLYHQGGVLRWGTDEKKGRDERDI